jgi:hypothetical protein
LNGAAPLDDDELDRLALMPPIEYGQVRKQVADQLGTAVGYLDAAVTARKKELTPTAIVGSGRPLDMPTIVPAEHPVDGAMLLQKMLDIFVKYLVLPDHAAVAIALWIMRAHCDDAFSISPRLAILSPVKRCGKTSLLEIIAKLLPRPLPTSNVTASVIFRVIEKHHPSLLIDEADSFMRDKEELRGIVNSGHRRDSAIVLRNVGMTTNREALAPGARWSLLRLEHSPIRLRTALSWCRCDANNPEKKCRAFAGTVGKGKP